MCEGANTGGRKMSFRLTTVFAVAAVYALLAGPAQAQPSAAQANAIRQSCRSDFMANCSGVQPGGADALACLQRNLAKLSGRCQTAVSPTIPAAQAPAAPPATASAPPPASPATATPRAAAKPAAAARPAPAAKPEPPPPSLPPAPVVAAAPTIMPLDPRPFIMPQRRLAILAICRVDAARLCGASLPRQTIRCLAAQASSLSPPCYDAIARVSR